MSVENRAGTLAGTLLSSELVLETNLSPGYKNLRHELALGFCTGVGTSWHSDTLAATVEM